MGVLGQLGHGDEEPLLLPKKVEAFADQRVVAVSAMGHHSIALAADGAVWSWGYGYCGRLGHGDQQTQLLPKKIEAFAGQRVTADGAVWSWGDGRDGKLGHGDMQSQLLPKKIEAFAGRRIVAVSAGTAHSLALAADGAVWSWGEGTHSCLGHGEDLSDQLLPKKIEAWALGR